MSYIKKNTVFFCLCLNKTSIFTHANVPVLDRYPKILFYSPFFTFGHCPFFIFFYKIFLQLLPEIYLTSRLLAGKNLCWTFWFVLWPKRILLVHIPLMDLISLSYVSSLIMNTSSSNEHYFRYKSRVIRMERKGSSKKGSRPRVCRYIFIIIRETAKK
mgnify:CR=1 FL=1